MSIRLKPRSLTPGASGPLRAPSVQGLAPQGIRRVRLVRQLPNRPIEPSGVLIDPEALSAGHAGEADAADAMARTWSGLANTAGGIAYRQARRQQAGDPDSPDAPANQPEDSPVDPPPSPEDLRAESEAMTWGARIGNTLDAAGRLVVNAPVEIIQNIARTARLLEKEIDDADLLPRSRATVKGDLARRVPEAFLGGSFKAEQLKAAMAAQQAEETIFETTQQRGIDSARRLLQRQHQAGVFSDPEAEAIGLQITDLWETQERDRWLQSDPDQVLAAMEDPTLDERGLLQSIDPEDRPQFQQKALARQAERRADAAERVADLTNPNRLFRSWRKVEEELEASNSSPAMREQVRYLYENGEPMSWETLAHARRLMERYDPSTDSSGIEYYRLRQGIAIMAPAGMRDWMLTRLDQTRAPLDSDEVLRSATRSQTMEIIENYLSNQPLNSEAQSRALLTAEMELDQLLSQMDANSLPEAEQLYKQFIGQDADFIPEYHNNHSSTPIGRIHRVGRMSRMTSAQSPQSYRPLMLNLMKKTIV